MLKHVGLYLALKPLINVSTYNEAKDDDDNDTFSEIFFFEQSPIATWDKFH